MTQGPTGAVTLGLDPFSPDFLADPYRHHPVLRDAGPVLWLEAHGIYGLARFAEVSAALHDWQTFTSARGVGLADEGREHLLPYAAATFNAFGPTFRALDHRPLHELAGTDPATFQPDAASLAGWIRAQVATTLPQVDRIDLYETRGCGVVLSWGAEEPVLPV